MRAGLPLLYFALLGLAFLLVEIPLIQRFILYLDHPSYAMAAVLFSLLLFSGLGSRVSSRLPLGWSLAALVVYLLALPFLLPGLFELTLGQLLFLRLAYSAAILAPAGFLMGVPFAGGIRLFFAEGQSTALIPWAWGVNGALSVVASELAAALALAIGFNWVFRLGALCYGLAALALMAAGRWVLLPRLRR